jgi:hypothetical protein
LSYVAASVVGMTAVLANPTTEVVGLSAAVDEVLSME